MKKILLCCNAGMSTSILVKKLQDFFNKNSYEAEIEAIAVEKLKDFIEKVDLVLLGPQIKFKENEVKVLCDKYNKKYEVIPFTLYGTMNAEKIFEDLIKNKI